MQVLENPQGLPLQERGGGGDRGGVYTGVWVCHRHGSTVQRVLHVTPLTNVTADIIAHQVLLNRVPEQATEDSVKYQIYY